MLCLLLHGIFLYDKILTYISDGGGPVKRLLIILVVLASLLGLVGCDPGTYYFDSDELLSNTVKIELVHYENENPKIIYHRRIYNPPFFDFSKVTLIATLDDSQIDDVVNDIADSGYLTFPRTMNEPIGTTIILYQSNGNMIVIYYDDYENKSGEIESYGGCTIFDKNGKFVEQVGPTWDYAVTLATTYFDAEYSESIASDLAVE